MKRKAFITLGLAGLLMTACQDHENLYSEDYASAKKQQEYASSFGEVVGNIDPNQDWNLFTTANVQVTVNEDWGEKYTVKVYTANPLDETSCALLLAKGEVVSGNTFTTNITLPKSLSSVFVGRVDSHNRAVYSIALVRNGEICASFGDTTTRSVSTRGENDYIEANINAPYTNAEINEFLEYATPLKKATNDDLFNGGTFKVEKGDSLACDQSFFANDESYTGGYKSKIIVSGTLQFTSGNTFGGNMIEIIIANGGKLNLPSGSTLDNSCGGRFVVLYGGSITGNGSIKLHNGSTLYDYNAGTVECDTINNNYGTLYNVGTIKVDTYEGNQSTFYNEGYLKARIFGQKNTRIHNLYNYCYIECTGSAYITNAVLGDNSQLNCTNDMHTGLGIWNVGNHALIYVGGYYEQNKTSIIGPTEGEYALLKITGNKLPDDGSYGSTANIQYDGWPNIKEYGYIINNVFVEYNTENSALAKLQEVLNGGTYNSGYTGDPVGNNNTKISSIGQTPYYNPQASECAQVITVPDDVVEEEEDTPYYVYYAFEDMGSIGDYDFNDVILRVYSPDENGNSKIQVVAAGGTLPVAIYYGSQVLWADIHDAYGIDGVINVIPADYISDYLETTINVGTDADISQLDLSIKVTSETGTSQTATSQVIHSGNTTGEAPQCLCIPAGWKWPQEIVTISKVYPNFKGWSEAEGTNLDWWSNVSSTYSALVIDPSNYE